MSSAPRKSSHLDRILVRLEDLDAGNLAILVQRLARERALLEAVFNTIEEGILVINASGIVEYANAASTRLIGLSQADVGKAVIWKVMPDLARSLKVARGTTPRLSPSAVSRELEITYPEYRLVRLYLVPLEADSPASAATAGAEGGTPAAGNAAETHSTDNGGTATSSGRTHNTGTNNARTHNTATGSGSADGSADSSGSGELDEGDGNQFAMIMADITEEKLSTEERIENERLSSIFDLAAGVAHELGNPLNSIHIHLQLMQRQLDKEQNSALAEKMQRSLEVCSQEVKRLDDIISHFLNAIRPQQPDLQEVALLDVLGEVLTVLGEQLSDLKIRVDLHMDEQPPPVMADRNQIKQVFFNVVKNAMEAMDSGGCLLIGTHTDDEFVTLSFADTGVGIAQEDLSKIFQPYYTSKRGGHGLGMMVCQRIMREHGGLMGIDSREGQGTTVTLQFPQKQRRMRLLQ